MKFKTLTGWCDHVEKLHQSEIPEGFTTAQYCYHVISKLPTTQRPRCVVCKEPTEWNENTLKYNRFCSKKSCKEKAAKKAKENMVKKYGKEHLLNDPDVQKKMLSNRKISGVYKFKSGAEFSYVGSYEHDFLITLDQILNWDSNDLMAPSPNIYKYQYEGKEHFYIPDFFIPSINLEIEIKEAANGHGRENTHWKIQQVDKVKEKLKDEVLNKNKNVNYIKVVNKEYEEFVNKVDELRGPQGAEVQTMADLLRIASESVIVESSEESVMTAYAPIVPYQGTLKPYKLQSDPQDFIEYDEGRVPFTQKSYDELMETVDDEDPDDIEDAMEGYVIPDKDLAINIDKWKPGVPLLIGGASGDGKTTISRAFKHINPSIALCSGDFLLVRLKAKDKEDWDAKYKRFTNIDYEHKTIENDRLGMELISDFISTHNIPYNLKLENREKINQIMTQFLHWAIEEIRKNPKYNKKKIIIDTCNICSLDPEFLVQYPLIILGTSRLQGLFRRAKRSSEGNAIKFVKKFIISIQRYSSLMKGIDDEKAKTVKAINKIVDTALSNVTKYSIEEMNDEDILFKLEKGTVTESYNPDDQNRTSSLVLFTKEITPESLCNIFKAYGANLAGNVGVKLSTGEAGNPNYLKPDLIRQLIQMVNGTIVECNTAYPGKRNTVEDHLKVARDHGFFTVSDVDIQDAEGEDVLPVPRGTYLASNVVGSHFKNYDSYLVLSHFKGHPMGGFGGAIKNISIGFASRRGKALIHTAGKDDKNIMNNKDQSSFIWSMAEAALSVKNAMKGNMIFINVINNLSIDCDCVAHPAPIEMDDIGIAISTDPVALDDFCLQLVNNAPKSEKFMKRVHDKKGIEILTHGEEIGLGTRHYKVINIDDITPSQMVTEGLLHHSDDVYYNKKKLDSGEINLCFIVGYSGSGKTYISHNYANTKYSEVVETDLLNTANGRLRKMTKEDVKHTSRLLYSFLYEYLINPNSVYTTDTLTNVKSLCNYAKIYAKNHPEKRFLIEGLWTLWIFKPEELKDYAVFIKGTSGIKSAGRSILRNANREDNIAAAAISGSVQGIGATTSMLALTPMLKKYRDYFGNLEKTGVVESKLSTEDRNELSDSMFGVPELRKFPLNDRQHTLQAFRMFNHCPDEYKAELARRIKKAMKMYDIHMEPGPNNKIKNYW